MDLGLAGSTAVVTGGSKGMGLAIAETLASEGARVAVMARGRAGLDAAEEKLRAAGAPDAVGISVDMADAASIVDGFAVVADRWGELNSLVHTIGPGDGYFEEMGDAEWDAAFALGTCKVRQLPHQIAETLPRQCRNDLAGIALPRSAVAAGAILGE